MSDNILSVTGLRVRLENKEILCGVDLEIARGSTHVLMGPNGSGKTTLAQIIMGNPKYEVIGGKLLYEGGNLLPLRPEERSMRGIFMSFQNPYEIPGVNVGSYLRAIYNKRFSEAIPPVRFRKIIKKKTDLIKLGDEMLDRYLNEGFSGGEKKKLEMLQMLVLEPKLAILDELDSGLDVDAIKLVAKVAEYLKKEKGTTLLIITHYTRVLKYFDVDKVYLLQDGRITKKGGGGLAERLEKEGFGKSET